MTRLAVLLSGVLALPLWAQDFPALHEVTGVAKGDVLNILAAPSAGAAVIGTLAPDAVKIEVLTVRDGWATVNAGDLTGFVSAAFLTRSEGPGWRALTMPLTCLGTEPFWSLRIDPERAEARYATPEDQAPRISPIKQTWPGEPWAAAAAISLPEGLVVMLPAECSDGMSDRSYGIIADFFLNETDGLTGQTRLSGCCLLVLE